MQIVKVDPRALVENPDRMRRTQSSPQADVLLLATIRAVGIIQPPIVSPQRDGGNGWVIDAGHRRVAQAIAAGLEEIEVLVDEVANDDPASRGAMRSMVENIAREALNPVDQWRAIERLVMLRWTEEAIAAALALPIRQIRKLRLLAGVLPAMLDQMAKGDMPEERQLRVIAAAAVEEQVEVWKKHRPKKGDTTSWWSVAQALEKRRMFARDAKFDDDLARAYGIAWSEDLFAPAGEDSRYTADVEAFLGAQHEWMSNHLPKRGQIVEATNWGEPKLPAKAQRVYGKPGKGDCTAMYLDQKGAVQTAVYRMPEAKKPVAKGKADTGSSSDTDEIDDVGALPKSRPDVTRKGIEMIGDLRTDALHEALAHAPIEDDTLTVLLVLAFAGQNVSVASGADGHAYGFGRMARHAVRLIGPDGRLAYDRETLQQVARAVLVDVLSTREDRTQSGMVARIAGVTIGADAHLPNMGTKDFLACLSRQALEAACADTSVQPKPRVKDTRAALVEHFKEERFVHPAALFPPDPAKLAEYLRTNDVPDGEDEPEVLDPAPLDEMDDILEPSPAETEDDGWRAAAE
ncbi:ParB N-terminal domain-containing protein [Pinisolibacter aquiterrae]|uniref:ParB N-terminal domain-containing protein n=3 Tax=Pinisolibacter aquiterrae TaxID=2815579 RepID=UPI001E56D0A4|nr:ParB N-terminal domain-containing protein [Pinisolibacter aquiterrae]MCC8235767.1 ParB N-terminal domain-containing protein [Pinisolibacter aquiterrae]